MFFAFSRGRRAFSIAAVLMLLTALAHTLGSLNPGSSPDERVLITQMAAFRVPVGLGMTPSSWDIYRDLTFTMSICLAGLGFVNLLLGASPLAPVALLKRVSWVNLMWVAGLTVLSLGFLIAPMVISGVLILVAIAVSLR